MQTLEGNPRGQKLTKAQQKLVIDNMGLVMAFIKKNSFLESNLDIDDLMQNGYYGLCIAAIKYNDKRTKFTTYATLWIKANVFCAATNFIVSINKQVRLDINKIIAKERLFPHLTRSELCYKFKIKNKISKAYILSYTNHEFVNDNESYHLTKENNTQDLYDTINEIFIEKEIDNLDIEDKAIQQIETLNTKLYHKRFTDYINQSTDSISDKCVEFIKDAHNKVKDYL